MDVDIFSCIAVMMEVEDFPMWMPGVDQSDVRSSPTPFARSYASVGQALAIQARRTHSDRLRCVACRLVGAVLIVLYGLIG